MSIIMTIVVSCQILITESPLSSKENREKIAQIVFETFKAPGLCIANSAVMSLFCSGRTRGVTVRSMSRFLSFLRSVEWWLHYVPCSMSGGCMQACIYVLKSGWADTLNVSMI
jgi:actin-related protein